MSLEKTYTLKSLEVWFQAYRKNWWNHFSKSEQERGKLLLNNGLSTIEVEINYLLVSGKKDQITYFATLDLQKKDQIVLQVSDEDEVFGRSLLAAGLFCLEQLFQNYLNVLSFAASVEQINEISEPKKLLNNATVSRSHIRLVFFKKDQSLAFEVCFKRGQQFQKLTSLKQNLKPCEREDLLSIMLQTQKYGFHWNKKCFVNVSLESLPDFVQNILPKLSRKYFVEVPQNVYDLCRGLNNIQVQLSANSTGNLLQHFFIPAGEIKQALVEHSVKAKNHIYWSEQYGLIRCQENTLKWIQRSHDWKNRLKKDEDLPSYMLLSLFNPHMISQEAQIWIQSLQKPLDIVITNSQLLRSYQRDGVAWLKHILDNHCHPLLADEMGLGKTRQLLTLLEILMRNSTPQPSLIICPASVMSAWSDECRMFYPHLDLSILDKETLSCYNSNENKIFVASYSQLLTNFHRLKLINFKCIILDEAQCIKNPKSKTAHACFNLKSIYRIAATGTPVENHVIDLWTIFHFLMPGFLGDFKEFQKFVQTKEALFRLKQQIAPFVLRRTQEEVLHELPQKRECIIYCPMTEKQRVLYDFTRDLSRNLKQGQWDSLLTLILRLRQICCDPGLLAAHKDLPIENSGKLVWLLKKLKEASQSQKKIIIFSQFKQLLDRLGPYIKNLYPQTYVLTGSTPTGKRAQLISNFQKTKDRTAFLISLKAGGTGITLHAADTLFILDPWWNPAVEEQAIARAHRLGQRKSLNVYRLLIENSIEANIQRLQQHKQQLFTQLFDVEKLQLPAERWQQLYQLLFNEKNSL